MRTALISRTASSTVRTPGRPSSAASTAACGGRMLVSWSTSRWEKTSAGVPSVSTRPLRMAMTRVAYSATSAMSWEMMTTVRPRAWW
ncbi:hypothetical protein, partial [Streptomyces sp. PpalLS-921]